MRRRIKKNKKKAGVRVSAPAAAFLQAARSCDIVQLRRALLAGADPNAADDQGNGLMQLRPNRNRHRAITALANAGTDLNYVTSAGHTPLMEAVIRGDRNLVQSLLKLGANPNFANLEHETALSYAAVWGRAAIAALLLDGGARPDNPRTPWTPLMYAAREGNGRVARLLLKAGASASRKDRFGRTACDIAIENGHDSLARGIEGQLGKKR